MNFKKLVFNLVIFLSLVSKSNAFTYKDVKTCAALTTLSVATMSFIYYLDDLDSSYEGKKALTKMGLMTFSTDFLIKKVGFLLCVAQDSLSDAGSNSDNTKPKAKSETVDTPNLDIFKLLSELEAESKDKLEFENAKSNITKNKYLIDFFNTHESIDQKFLEDLDKIYITSQFSLMHAYDDIKNLLQKSGFIVDSLMKVIDSETIEKDIKIEAKKMLKSLDSVYFSKLKKALDLIEKDCKFDSQKIGSYNKSDSINHVQLSGSLLKHTKLEQDGKEFERVQDVLLKQDKESRKNDTELSEEDEKGIDEFLEALLKNLKKTK